MREPLTIAVAQPACRPGDVAANAVAHARTIRSADARLVVFPELSVTGYELDAPAVAPDDPRLAPIIDACRDTGSVALVGAPAVGAQGTDSIAMLAADGTGARVAYRKMWLGSTETRRFSAGPAPAVLELDGWRLGLAICRDAGIAQHWADTVALGIDAYVAGSVKAVDEGEIQDERARRLATEHGIWVAVASGAGPNGGGYEPAAGRSGIWAADGSVVAQAGPGPGEIVRATLRDEAADQPASPSRR
ncbi:MAG TPA: carbon-nitrogen hydrolase family protein [Candidatus Limnocylindrales bacterium]|nr:carbon-nitrogen hydrolase family protein [Candidatus Limnocylindrales bacterium]